MHRNSFPPESSDALRALWDALLHALRTARQKRDYGTQFLRAPTVEFAARARRLDVAPEVLLVWIKRAAYEEGLESLSDYSRELLISRLVRWSIEAYYAVDLPDRKSARHSSGEGRRFP